MFLEKRNGSKQVFNEEKFLRQVHWACKDVQGVDSDVLISKVKGAIHDGMTTKSLNRAITVEAGSLISIEQPNWTYVAARMVLQECYKQVTGGQLTYPSLESYLLRMLENSAVRADLLQEFDLEALDKVVAPERDLNFDYMGAQIITDRYLTRTEQGQLIELPQHWLMRVAMGIALDEPTQDARTEAAIRYYEIYSLGKALSSTPTLFNSGTELGQLSSCFGTHFPDDTNGIINALGANANFSKTAGGCSASFTHLRAHGSYIRSTRGKAGGPVPFMKLLEDVLNAWDQAGKRKGVGVAYLEVWHADFRTFLHLHDPGDPRQRCFDLFLASWIPDLFMERLVAQEDWSFFDPADTPLLLSTYGEEFAKHYTDYEARGLAKGTMPAEELWQLILTKWVQQSVGWPCFKDEINHRRSQEELVNHSNLCTEITLRDDEETSFVCNLTSVNLSKFDFTYDESTRRLAWNSDLEYVVRNTIRMLDSVISIGSTPHASGRKFQLSDRAIGLGCMGLVELLYKSGVDYESPKAVIYSSEIWKQISATAIHESHLLSKSKGIFPKFSESVWAKGQLPIDTVRKRRVIDRFSLDTELTDCPFAPNGWTDLRSMVKLGMRNSTLMAIAPTATIAHILNTTPCTESPEDLVARKENLSGDFKLISPIVVNNPFDLKVRSAFAIDHCWTVWAAGARQLWIDQAQSTNYWGDPNTREDWADYIDNLLVEAWMCGVKTSYYFHSTSTASTATEVQVNRPGPADAFNPQLDGDPNYTGGRVCAIDAGPDCEACQ